MVLANKKNFLWIYLILFFIGLDVFGIWYELIYFLFLLMILRLDLRRVDTVTVSLFLYGLFVIISGLINGNNINITIIFKAMLYFSMYIIGMGIARRSENDFGSQEKILLYAWTALSLGFFTRFLIDVSMPDNWFVLTHYYARDIGTDIWSSGTVPTTILAGWCIPIACVLYYVFSSKVGNIKLLYFVVGISGVVFALISGTRTFIGVAGLSFLIIYLFEVFAFKRRKTKRVTAFIVITILVILIALSMNIGGVTTWLMKTSMFDRMINGSLQSGLLNDNGRGNAVRFLFSNLDKVLMGGEYCRSNDAMLHNWFLQCLDMYGLLPFTLLVMSIISTVKSIVLMIKNNIISPSFQILCINVAISLLCYAFIEPVITSNNVVISTYFLLFGFVNCVNRQFARRLEYYDEERKCF